MSGRSGKSLTHRTRFSPADQLRRRESHHLLTFSTMRKILFLLAFFLLACTQESGLEQELPQIEPTEISPDLFQMEVVWSTVELAGRTVSLPSDWEVVETPVEYLFWYDQGLTGSVVIDKNSHEIQIRDKQMPVERRVEAEQIVKGWQN